MSAQIVFVTGKGGAGKTTVAAALAGQLARSVKAVLVVETAADGALATRFGAPPLGAEPAPLGPRLFGVRIARDALVEAYFRRRLRVPVLAERLLASTTFRAITAAAPGVSEFLVLERLARWTERRRFGRAAEFDAVVVDAPASGHTVRLLRAPRQLAQLVPRGPIAARIADLRTALDERARITIVATAEEMAVIEALETRAAIDALGLQCTAPVLNRVWPRRFSAADAAELGKRAADEPLVAAARLALAAGADAERHRARLRRGFGVAPIALCETAGELVRGTLEAMGRALAPVLPRGGQGH
ncbi:MAG: ArsA family ATPase [Candidatus Binatia bacterium]